MPKTILITGATSGIGKALAFEMAKRGYSLALAGRRSHELVRIRDEIITAHPSLQVEIKAFDVTQYNTVSPAVNELADALGGLDIVVANAGVGPPAKIGVGEFDKLMLNIETNLIGAMATVDAAVSHFLKRGRGHIVGISSLAAFRGMPRNSAYSASKAGIAVFLETLRAEVLKKKIDVTVLYPGYIDTPINNMLKSRPFLISPEKGAIIIANMIEKKVRSSTVPVFPWNIIGCLMKILPVRIIAKM